jgi:translation initiation factor 5B
MKSEKQTRLQEEFQRLVKPGKIQLLPNYVFRKAKPAIVGVEVLAGRIKPRYELIKEDGSSVGDMMQIQDRGEAVSEANIGMQVAISLNKPTVGRQIHEKDILYVAVPEEQAKALMTKFQDLLTQDELQALSELMEIKRRKNPFWAA